MTSENFDEMSSEAFIEKVAEVFYKLGYEHAKTLGIDWGTGNYKEIPPEAKGFYRSFAIHIINRLGIILDVVGWYANPDHWMTSEEKANGQTVIKDGPAIDDQGDLARRLLNEIKSRNGF